MSDRDLSGTMDVEAHTQGRGADRAIRSAGRRRLAAAGGALVAVGVLGGILATTLGPSTDRPVSPAPSGTPTPSASAPATPAQDPLPEPKPFGAAVFNAAADGWTSGWTKGATPISTKQPCVLYEGLVLPEPLDSSTTEFASGKRLGATHQVTRFDSAERAHESFAGLAYGECQGEVIGLPDEIWTGGESVGSAVTNGGKTMYEIMIVHETELAVLQVAGAGELPEDVRKKLVRALLADLRT